MLMTRVILVAAATTFTALLAVGAAGAATPTAYRAQVNAICRTYNPTFRRLHAQVNDAISRNDQVAEGLALGQAFALALVEDGRIEKTPVPAAMRTTMTPILNRLKTIDSYIRLGQSKRDPSLLVVAGNLMAPLVGAFDAAGLRDCGSDS